MKNIFPPKLKKGDNIRIVAPSCSGKTIKPQQLKLAQAVLEKSGFRISFSKHLFEMNEFQSSSVKSRVADLHEAFLDNNVQGILAVRGGFSSNDLLDYIDWNTIKKNPKIYCGFSDNTALQNAILCKTGLVTYSGPNFATFGRVNKLKYTLDSFLNMVASEHPESLKNLHKIEVINQGRAAGGIIGGNLCTLNLLQGTQYLPDIKNKILFLEDDHVSELDPWEFHRNLQSIISLPLFKTVKGLVIGQFDPASKMPVSFVRRMVKAKPELSRIPVIANLNFGHKMPIFTFPIGGQASINTTGKFILTVK